MMWMNAMSSNTMLNNAMSVRMKSKGKISKDAPNAGRGASLHVWPLKIHYKEIVI